MLRSTVTKTLVKVTTGSAVLYGTGVALAMNNPQCHQIFIENVPYGGKTLELVEGQLGPAGNEISVAKLKEKFNSALEKSYEFTKSPLMSKKVAEVKPQAVAVDPVAVDSVAVPVEPVAVPADPVAVPADPVADTIAKSVKKVKKKAGEAVEPVKEAAKETAKEIEIVKEYVKSEVELPLLATGDIQDSSVRSLIDEFNCVLAKINSGSLTHEEKLDSLAMIIKKFDTDLTFLYRTSKEQLDLAIAEKENQLLKSFNSQFEKSVEDVEKRHSLQLSQEVKTAKDSLKKKLSNQIKFFQIHQQDEFTKIIAQAVEKERNSKLAHLDKLSSSLESLTDLVGSIESHLVNSETKLLLQLSLNKLKHKLASSTIQDLTPELKEIAAVAVKSSNPLLRASVAAIDPALLKSATNPSSALTEKSKVSASGSVLTHAQIIARFALLAPELRTAAILPPNAGVLGHLSAKMFSAMLMSKSGHVEGKDIESIIARVENYLTLGKLDCAVEEVANLKGWSRKLADDWVKESRKRLEMEFLVGLMDLESRTLF